MGYLFLALALFFGSVKGYCGKKTSGFVQELPHIVLMNLIRMVLCILIGAGFAAAGGKGLAGFSVNGKELLICFVSGFSTAMFVITWIICVRQSAYTMLEVVLVLATCVPVLLCYLIWQEQIGLQQIIGFILLFTAVIFMTLYNNKIKVKLTLKGVGLLILCGLFYGISLFSQKWRIFSCKEALSAYTFNFYTYIFSGAVLGILYICAGKNKKSENPFDFKKISAYILVMAICLFLNSLFASFASERLDSAVMYPMQQGCALILSMLMGHLFFGEKIKIYSVIGVTLSIIAFIVMNLRIAG